MKEDLHTFRVVSIILLIGLIPGIVRIIERFF